MKDVTSQTLLWLVLLVAVPATHSAGGLFKPHKESAASPSVPASPAKTATEECMAVSRGGVRGRGEQTFTSAARDEGDLPIRVRRC